ncbi:MAG: MFS transporter [Candidatus Methylacidiphilales bacterium]
MKWALDEGMPPKVWNAWVFQIFNTISFTMVLGAPILLYFKRLGASATILGIVLALSPLLNTLQIPAARYVERVGYKRLVVAGWTARCFFILAMAGVAVLPEQIDAMTRMGLMLVLLFIYNALRGISVCGFMPWIAQLVPEQVRGRFVSLELMFGQGAAVLTMGIVALYLEADGTTAPFAPLFIISFVAGLISLRFLRRIPDVPVPAQANSSEPVPWREIFRFQPFQRLVRQNAIVLSAYGAGAVLILPMCRDKFGMTDPDFLLMNVAGGGFFVVACWILGRLVDFSGSRPMLVTMCGLHAFHFGCWGLVAAGLMPFTWPVILFQAFTWSVGFAMFMIANTRLAMATVPALGRSHFFAIYSVAHSLVSGVSPIVWGLLLDMLKGLEFEVGGIILNRFSFLYLGVSLIMMAGLAALRTVHEAKSMTTEDFLHKLFVESPTRAISRLWPRHRIP